MFFAQSNKYTSIIYIYCKVFASIGFDDDVQNREAIKFPSQNLVRNV